MCLNSLTTILTSNSSVTLADSSWKIQLSTPAFSQIQFLRQGELPVNNEIEPSWSAQITSKLTVVKCPLSLIQLAQQQQLLKIVKVSGHMYRKWEASPQLRLKTLASASSTSLSSSNRIILLRPKQTLLEPLLLRSTISNQVTLPKGTCFNSPTLQAQAQIGSDVTMTWGHRLGCNSRLQHRLPIATNKKRRLT